MCVFVTNTFFTLHIIIAKLGLTFIRKLKLLMYLYIDVDKNKKQELYITTPSSVIQCQHILPK